MTKVQIAKVVLTLGGSQGIIIPSVGTGDNGVITISLEGSSSMYEPIQILREILRESGQTIEVNILPLGASSGKNSYKEGQVDLILSSIDEKKANNNSAGSNGNGEMKPYEIGSDNAETAEGNQQIYLAQDPLAFVFKKDPSCTNEIKYEPYDLNAILKGNDSKNGTKKKGEGNRKEFMNIFIQGTNTVSDCLYRSLIREGGKDRSNLTKAFLKTPLEASKD